MLPKPENGTRAKGVSSSVATYIDWIVRGLHCVATGESQVVGYPSDWIEENAKSQFSCICSFVMFYLNGTKFSYSRVNTLQILINPFSRGDMSLTWSSLKTMCLIIYTKQAH